MKHIVLALSAWLMIISQAVAQNQYTEQDIEQMVKNTSSTKDEGFTFFSKNKAMINGIMGDHYAENQLMAWIYKTEIASSVEGKDPQPDWKLLKKNTSKYGVLGEEIYLKAKTYHFYNQGKKGIIPFADAAAVYVSKYGASISSFDSNNWAWRIFENSGDKKALQNALVLSNHSLKDSVKNLDITYLDTKANILYRLGKKKEAIELQKYAVQKEEATAEKHDLKTFQSALEKMENNLPTWP